MVIYESLTGNTARAARLVADEVAEQGVEVSVYPITDIGLKDLAEADIVFIGTWVDGLVLFGHRPGRAGRIRSMPVIDGKRVAAFMTFAIHAGKALDRFARVLEERGATVVSRTLLRRDRLEAGIAEFVTASLDSVPAYSKVSALGADPAPSARLGESPCVPRPAEPSSGRWPWSSAWCSSAWRTPAGARTEVGRHRAGFPQPRVPRDPGDGCGEAATTDPGDLAVDRTLAAAGRTPRRPSRWPRPPPCGWP